MTTFTSKLTDCANTVAKCHPISTITTNRTIQRECGTMSSDTINDDKSAKTTAYGVLCINGSLALLILLYYGVTTLWSIGLPNPPWLNVANGYSMVYLFLFALSYLLGEGAISPIKLLSDLLLALQVPQKLNSGVWRRAMVLFLSTVLLWLPAALYPRLEDSLIGVTLLLCYMMMWVLAFRALHHAEQQKPTNIDSLEAQKEQQHHVQAVLLFLGMICSIGCIMLLLQSVYWLLAPEEQLAEMGSPHFLVVFSAIGFVLVLFIGALYNRHAKQMRSALEQMQLAHQVEQSQLYIALLTQKYHTLQRYQHDYKKHLVYIQQLAEQGEAERISQYISTVYEDLQNGTLQKLTGNQTLDILLSEKLQTAANQSVQIEIDYQPNVQLDHIGAPDLCILLGNLLDNAITAAEGSAQKQIQCSFRKKNQYYSVISVMNSCDQAPIMTDGVPISTKADDGHGYGVQNVLHCVQKYGGVCEFRYEQTQRQFYATVLLPDSD